MKSSTTPTPFMLDRFRLAYRLDFQDGTPRVTHGRPPQKFVSAAADIARLHGIDRGQIECVGRGRHARLRFSKDFPNRGRQAIRNAWTAPVAWRAGGDRHAGG